MLRLSTFFFLFSFLPAVASAPPDSWRQTSLSRAAEILLLARDEMPLPVVAIETRANSNGKLEFVVKMSAAGLPWAKEPVLSVSFEIPDEGISIEEALQKLSSFAREYIAAREKAPLKELSSDRIADESSSSPITDESNAE